MTYELVPPDNHRRNIAEEAIQTWKDHFVTVISGAAAMFPMHLWCRMIPQAERQLQLLMFTNTNPKVSTCTHLHGPHNYNAQPWVPIGIEAMIHDKPNKRKTFAQHCSKGYGIETSTEHYRCWKLWNIKTKSMRISDTVFFKHKYITNPSVTPEDAVISAANRMSAALQAYKPNNMQEEDIDALRRLEAIFTEATNNGGQVEIEAKASIPTPRVRAQQKLERDKKALTAALEEMAKPPRVGPTVFKEDRAPPPRVESDAPELIVACPRAVVTSRYPTPTIPIITQDDESVPNDQPQRPTPRRSARRPIPKETHTTPAGNTRSHHHLLEQAQLVRT